MRKFDIEKKLHKILKKLYKKNKERFEIIWKKIKEIVNNPLIEHYKNLKSPLQNFKRFHINKNFDLKFKYDKVNDKLFFYDYDHHDNIYKKR